MVVAILAVILAVILDFSLSSRIFACYPPDFHYIGANDAKSTVKKLYHPRAYLGGTLAIIRTHSPGDASCWQYNIGRPR